MLQVHSFRYQTPYRCLSYMFASTPLSQRCHRDKLFVLHLRPWTRIQTDKLSKGRQSNFGRVWIQTKKWIHEREFPGLTSYEPQ